VKPVAIVTGYSVRYPLGGHVFAQLSIYRGLQRLGYEVIFIEHYGWTNSCYMPPSTMTDDPSYGLTELRRYMERLGIRKWCYIDAQDRYHGMATDDVRRACRQCEFLLSLASPTWLDEFYECKRRIYFDTDPGFTQFKLVGGRLASCAGFASPHDFQFHFTIGERIGKPDCPIPTSGLNWQPIRYPVALDLIPARVTPPGKLFTTVMSWTSYGNVEYNGVTYGQKDVELRRFIDLPTRAGKIFEIALAGPNAPVDKLREAGWMVTDPLAATRNVDAFLDYIAGSRGEFSVAKNCYVQTRSGWFSDRTAAYLAVGRPAIVQETGFSEFIPTGEGLFAFETADDVLNAVDAIQKDYRRHSEAARRIAQEHFDSDKLLGSMLKRCGL
jgi:hypothetical protein